MSRPIRALLSVALAGVLCASLSACSESETPSVANNESAPPASSAPSSASLPEMPAEESFYLFRASELAKARALVESGDARTVAARDAMVREAEAMLEIPIVTVVDGKDDPAVLAPSGDPHDYVSLSPYWWPDPEKEDGLPYIRRDGEINPDRKNYDVDKLGAFGDTVRGLAMGYFVTGDERYAERAIEHLRAWYIDPDTRMNPRIEYGQFVPGREEGRPGGIIETNRIRFVADAIAMLRASPSWTESDESGVREWYAGYLDWLLNSELGKRERAARNNHGTWFAAQAAQYALVAGNTEVVEQMSRVVGERVTSQIEPDGSQPLEIERTRGLDYCCFNLRALMDLSTYAARVGVDTFGFETDDGRSIRAALAFVKPYATQQEEWPYQQISPTRYNMFNQLFRMSANRLDAPEYGEAALGMPELDEDDQWMAYVWPIGP